MGQKLGEKLNALVGLTSQNYFGLESTQKVWEPILSCCSNFKILWNLNKPLSRGGSNLGSARARAGCLKSIKSRLEAQLGFEGFGQELSSILKI